MKVSKKYVHPVGVANKIIERLFVNGSGEAAERLVMTSADGRDLGGWCMSAVRDRIIEVLKSELKNKRKKAKP